jgi:hypothetical protein
MQIALALVPLFVAAQSPQAPGYKHVGGHGGVEVYRQMRSPVIELLAEGDIEAPPSQVRAVVLDYPHARAVTDHVVESRILQAGSHELYVYQRLDLPVVADRDYTMHASWGNQGDVLTVHFNVDNSKGPAARDGVVRVSTLTGSWELRPIRDGMATHAVYHVQIDMAGSIPKWMVSGGAAKDLPKLFDGVRRQVRQRALSADARRCDPAC